MKNPIYTLSERVHVDCTPPRAGVHIVADYDAGDHQPKDDAEAELFAYLVDLGLAKPSASRAARPKES